ADGMRVLYPADGAFLGAPGFPQFNGYFANRTVGGWQSRSVSALLPYFAATTILEPISIWTIPNGLSIDGRKTVIGTNRDPDTGQKVPTRVYIVDLVDGTRERVSPEPLAGDANVFPGNPNAAAQVSGSDTFDVLYYASVAQLVSDSLAPAVPATAEKLYRHEDGHLTLASWTPSGQPSPGILVDNFHDVVGRNTATGDGSVYWFTPAGSSFGYPLHRGEVGVERSAFVNESENEDVVVAPGDALFQGAAADGSRAFFTSNQALITGMQSGFSNLFMYEHSADPASDENLTLISRDLEPADGLSGGVAEVLGTSDDGEIVYFTSSQQLVSGESVAAGQKLYRWNDGVLEYLAHAAVSTSGLNIPLTSPDGRYLLFQSNSHLTSEDGGGFVQQYVFDGDSGAISCASCRSGGVNTSAAFQGDSFATFMGVTPQPRRWLSDDGQVFFHTGEPLLSRDTNGQVDIYTWKDGRLDLVSSGRGTSDARFVDAGADGGTVLFITRDQLTSSDTDLRMDLYAARIGGGFPEPEAGPGDGCQGDGCQGQSSQAPPSTDLGSRRLQGSGNPTRAAQCGRFATRIRAARRDVRRLRGRSRVLRRQARQTRAGEGRARVLRVRAVRLKRRASRRSARIVVLQRQYRGCREAAR
ncbi:MAG: hypothetical protein GX596_08280, partial [Propionibacterium sp.]|nr:hypothetical protein [Propionibacterium sp.]